METLISENILRVGNFTSSEVYKLMTNGKGANGFGAPAISYIAEKNVERKMGLSLGQEISTRAMAWGHFMEIWVHEKHLELDYQSVGKETIKHPTIDFWAGSPDHKNISKSIVCDTKAYQRKSFAEYADSIMLNSVDALRIDHPKEYWQLVSNAIILGVNFIQPILFMPYKSELADIKEFANNYDGDNLWQYKYIYDAMDAELPYLKDGGYYKNVTTCILEVPEADKKMLTEKVILAGSMLKEFYETN